jgi:ATP-dependent exoDNAse (exonuclease V) beta subunit
LAGYQDQEKGRNDDEAVAQRRVEIEVATTTATKKKANLLDSERKARLNRAAPTFDSREHRCLEGELKDLYVAFTRARRKLWIFDDRGVNGLRSRRSVKDKSDTMYDYFQRRSLVVTDDVDGDGGINVEQLESFDEGSTDEEWAEQTHTSP